MDIIEKKYKVNIEGMIVEEIDETDIGGLDAEELPHYLSESVAPENVIVAV